MSEPLVSVIVPVRDGERFLGAALESVFQQAHRPLEVVVVDDGSTDGSAGIARSFPGVVHLLQDPAGVAAARNAGRAASRGEILAFLDSDDLWTPDKLERQVAFLVENPHVGYVLAHMRHFLEGGCERPAWCSAETLARVELGLVPGTLVVRTEAFDRVGPFDPAYRCGSDTDWFFRAKDAGVPFAILREVLLERRIHDANLSGSRGPDFPILARIVKSSMQRMRAKRGIR